MKFFGIFFGALIALILSANQSNSYDRSEDERYSYPSSSESQKANSRDGRYERDGEYSNERQSPREEYEDEKREKTYNSDRDRETRSYDNGYSSRQDTMRSSASEYPRKQDSCPFFNKSVDPVHFFYAIGTSSFATRLTLTCSRVKHKSTPVNLKTHTYMENDIEKSLYDISEKGTVPLFKHGSKVYTEGPAILFYISDKCGSYNLLGDDKYRGLEIINFIATDIFRNATPIFDKRIEVGARTRFIEKTKEKLLLLDKTLVGKNYFIGDRETIIDFYAFSIFLIIKAIPEIDLTEFTNLSRFFDRIQSLPCANQAFRMEIEENQKNNKENR